MKSYGCTPVHHRMDVALEVTYGIHPFYFPWKGMEGMKGWGWVWLINQPLHPRDDSHQYAMLTCVRSILMTSPRSKRLGGEILADPRRGKVSRGNSSSSSSKAYSVSLPEYLQEVGRQLATKESEAERTASTPAAAVHDGAAVEAGGAVAVTRWSSSHGHGHEPCAEAHRQLQVVPWSKL